MRSIHPVLRLTKLADAARRFLWVCLDTGDGGLSEYMQGAASYATPGVFPPPWCKDSLREAWWNGHRDAQYMARKAFALTRMGQAMAPERRLAATRKSRDLGHLFS